MGHRKTIDRILELPVEPILFFTGFGMFLSLVILDLVIKKQVIVDGAISPTILDILYVRHYNRMVRVSTEEF